VIVIVLVLVACAGPTTAVEAPRLSGDPFHPAHRPQGSRWYGVAADDTGGYALLVPKRWTVEFHDPGALADEFAAHMEAALRAKHPDAPDTIAPSNERRVLLTAASRRRASSHPRSTLQLERIVRASGSPESYAGALDEAGARRAGAGTARLDTPVGKAIKRSYRDQATVTEYWIAVLGDVWHLRLDVDDHDDRARYVDPDVIARSLRLANLSR
jgi:hypothetical protein